MSTRRTTRYQDAVRVLFLLDVAGDEPGAEAPPEAIRAIHAEARLQALDFWMRNPDYLARELIVDHDEGRRADGLERAADILDSEEPDLRRYPMIRYLFGAYEPLDDALALLRTSGLVQVVREGSPDRDRVTEHHFYLLRPGAAAAVSILEQAPALGWYRDRAALVLSVARDTVGSRLKERQYRSLEYATTRLGTPIGSIAASVRSDLAARQNRKASVRDVC